MDKKSRSGISYLAIAVVGIATTCSIAIAQQAAVTAKSTTVITACGELFAIDSNADKMTAKTRTEIVQKRLDDALVAAKDRTPSAVKVQILNRNPVVTLDNYLIVTADGNSAARARLTQLQLAEKWADSIRQCLAHTDEVNKYISMLTGKFEKKVAVAETLEAGEVAVCPSEMLMPISLAAPIACDGAGLGDHVEAVITHDVPLRPKFDSYIPAGSRVLGEIKDANLYVPNKFAGKDGITVSFYEIRLPDGKTIPITGHIYGGLNDWRMVHIKPTTAEHVNSVVMEKDDAMYVNINLAPKNGVIVGGWKTAPVDEQTQTAFRRMVIKRHPGLLVPSGEPMMMQLSGTTSIAFARQSTL